VKPFPFSDTPLALGEPQWQRHRHRF